MHVQVGFYLREARVVSEQERVRERFGNERTLGK